MLIYDRFVFLHMPRTGGTFIRQALREELSPPVEELETHGGWETIPAEAAERPVLLYVRNPWDWYVSFYHFMIRSRTRKPPPAISENPWLRLIFGEDAEMTDQGLRGFEDFASVVRRACESITPDHPLMAEMIESGDPHAQAIQFGADFYSTRFMYLAGSGLGTDRLTVGRFESLIEDLDSFLRKSRVPTRADLMTRIGTREPLNISSHRAYRDYYDDESRSLVERSCRLLVERFDYTF